MKKTHRYRFILGSIRDPRVEVGDPPTGSTF